MTVSPGYKSFVVEQLEHFAAITSKSMFGGVGIYADGVFFAVLDDDRIYFKVDDTNRPDFEAEGTGPFRPYNDERTMNYYEVPVDVLEDVDRLKEWAAKAVDVALRSKKGRKKR